jgi:hypothetical protein
LRVRRDVGIRRIKFAFSGRLFYGIINAMKMKTISLAVFLLSALVAPAHANWETAPYVYEGYAPSDSGGNLTMSFRGGAVFGTAKMQNDVGALVPEPFWEAPDGTLVSEGYCGGAAACTGAGYVSIGSVNVGDLPVKKKYGSFAWSAAVSIGWTLPDAPHWRIEADWNHIAESEYNSIPLFDGFLTTENGYQLSVLSGGVHSTVATEIISAMFYYDFYDGCGDGKKPRCEIVPYVGLGFGYASSNTELVLSDIYGDLSGEIAMQDFGQDDGLGILNFYTSETKTGNFAASLAAGFSYSIAADVYLDLGLRLTYVPRVKWALNNSADQSAATYKTKDMFSAKSIIYGSVMAGLRIEF